MDVHKEKIVAVGLPEEGNHPVMREEFGGNDLSRLVKRLRQLAKSHRVEACYEAGPCGYGLARALLQAGMECRVAAPSLIPRRPGDRIKTDGRDARELALAFRANTLSFVRIPSREDIAKEVRRVKHIIAHWLLIHEQRPPKGVKGWTQAHWRWMRGLELSSLDRTVLDHYLDVLHLLAERLKQIEQQVVALAETAPYRERVTRLRAFKGFSPLAAMRVIAEVMDFRRFPRAAAFMKFTGLVPSEYSSLDRIRRGRITKAGNSHLRCVLVEAVQRGTRNAHLGRDLLKRMTCVSGPLREVALRCLTRLHHKFWKLTRRGVAGGKVKVALARELAGFVWAMMTLPETPEATAA